MATIFSRIIAGEIPSYKVAENEQFYAFLDINPLVKGHTLVVPKREVDYIFDLEDFAKFEGKTGPYIQYAIARINSILRKAEEKNITPNNVIITTADERNLALKIAQLNAAVWRAHTEKEPHPRE